MKKELVILSAAKNPEGDRSIDQAGFSGFFTPLRFAQDDEPSKPARYSNRKTDLKQALAQPDHPDADNIAASSERYPLLNSVAAMHDPDFFCARFRLSIPLGLRTHPTD